MSLLRPRIHDDRGRIVAPPSPADQREHGDFLAAFSHEGDFGWRAGFRRWIISGWVVATLVLLGGSVYALWRSRPATLPILPAASYGLILLTLAIGFAQWRRSRRPDERRHCIRHGRCASCLQDLRELAAEPDGCTICPECGAAWRLPGESSKAAEQQSSK